MYLVDIISHIVFCLLESFYLKIEFLCLKFYHPFFICNLQLLIYISHSVSVCVSVCCASICVCMCVLVCKRYFRICFRCSLFCSLLRLPLKHSIYIIN